MAYCNRETGEFCGRRVIFAINVELKEGYLGLGLEALPSEGEVLHLLAGERHGDFVGELDWWWVGVDRCF